MIESGVIVYSFILAGIVSAACFGVFIWMNLKGRDLDEDLYAKKKNIRNIVSKHKHTGEVQDESIDSLKKYSVSEKKETAEEKEKISHRDAEGTEDTEEKEKSSFKFAEDIKKDIEKEDKESLAKKYSREARENSDQKLEDNIITEPMSEDEYNRQFKPKD